MPTNLPRGAIENADAAIAYARQTRAYHRRRTDKESAERISDIAKARERLADAMQPLRSEMGRFPYGPSTSIAEKNRQIIRDKAAEISAERRKLTKMANA